jgi:type I restriction enzyme S subunit
MTDREDIEGDLPEGWAESTLGSIVEFRYGKALKQEDRRPGVFTVFGSNGVVGTHDESLTDGPTIVVGRKGSIGAVHFSETPCWPIDTTYYINDSRGMDWIFLAHLLRSLNLPELDTSSAIPGLNRDIAYALTAHLPPLAEQKRIVAKVEDLLARVSAARERLARVPAILKRFRQSVLAAACSGRLTEDWRAEHPDVEPASALLERIRAERRKKWAESPGKRKGKYQEPEPADASDLPELPEGWGWSCGGQLFDWSSGRFLPGKDQKPGQYPVYGGNGVAGQHEEYLVADPTLVVGRVGALCGNVYLTSGKAWVTDNAIYASSVPHDVNLSYVYSVFSQANLNANAGGSGQPFVNQGTLNDTIVPLPPLAEQHEIVRRVEALFARADEIERRVAAGTLRAENITQAVLAKAFRGELVPTEADLARVEGRSFETAGELLERVRRERAGEPRPTRGRSVAR